MSHQRTHVVSGLLLLLAGCVSPGERAKEMVRETFDQPSNVVRILDALDRAKGGETGGVVFYEDGQYQLEEIPNKYLRLLEIIGEFEQRDYRNRQEFRELLLSSRQVHLHNSSLDLVVSIDEVSNMMMLPVPLWQLPYMKVVCSTKVLPFTYCAARTSSHDVEYEWHSHLNSVAHSPIDLANSRIRPEAVVYSQEGVLRVVIATDGKIEYSQILPQTLASR